MSSSDPADGGAAEGKTAEEWAKAYRELQQDHARGRRAVQQLGAAEQQIARLKREVERVQQEAKLLEKQRTTWFRTEYDRLVDILKAKCSPDGDVNPARRRPSLHSMAQDLVSRVATIEALHEGADTLDMHRCVGSWKYKPGDVLCYKLPSRYDLEVLLCARDSLSVHNPMYYYIVRALTSPTYWEKGNFLLRQDVAERDYQKRTL